MFADTNEYGGDGKTAADWMYDAANAVEEYNSALESGDTSKIDEASKSFYGIKGSINSLLDNTDMGKYSSMFSEVFGQVNKRLDSQMKLEKLLARGPLKNSGELLKSSGLTALDLKQAIDTEELQPGETQLNHIIELADAVGYISKESKEDVRRLIDTLASLGYVAGGSTSDTSKSFGELETSTKTAIETQNNLTAALAAGNSTAGMTAEQINDVTNAFKNLDGFSPDTRI